MTRPQLSNRDARRLFLQAHGLLARPGGTTRADDVVKAVTDLGFVQVDSINTIAQAHDHILWSRRPMARQGALHRCAAKHRGLFEGWTHDAALIPSAFFKHWRHKHAADKEALAKRWDGWGRKGFDAEFDAILARITKEGGLTAGEIIDGAAQTSGGWWEWKPQKTALEFLWRSGDLSICHRRGFTKVYDLTERVLPPEALNARTDPDESLNWSALAALDRRGFATPSELSAFWDMFPKKALADWSTRRPADSIEIDVEGADGRIKPALIHADWEARLAALPQPSPRLRILSPFAPALRDRTRAQRLSLTGRIDIKADRAEDTLRIQGYWPERGVKLGQGRAKALAAELARLAKLARVTQLSLEDRPATEILRQSAEFKAALAANAE